MYVVLRNMAIIWTGDTISAALDVARNTEVILKVLQDPSNEFTTGERIEIANTPENKAFQAV